MIHGARTVVQQATPHADRAGIWLTQLIARRHVNVAAVAVAKSSFF